MSMRSEILLIHKFFLLQEVKARASEVFPHRVTTTLGGVNWKNRLSAINEVLEVFGTTWKQQVLLETKTPTVAS